jgi:GrpB-like predicted nucleotidyltransferase (UPF0157 family)
VAGGDEERRTLAFRDYLRAHPEALAVYASLKRDLAERFAGDTFESRSAYAAAKTDFVEDAVRRALAEGLPRGL